MASEIEVTGTQTVDPRKSRRHDNSRRAARRVLGSSEAFSGPIDGMICTRLGRTKRGMVCAGGEEYLIKCNYHLNGVFTCRFRASESLACLGQSRVKAHVKCPDCRGNRLGTHIRKRASASIVWVCDRHLLI